MNRKLLSAFLLLTSCLYSVDSFAQQNGSGRAGGVGACVTIGSTSVCPGTAATTVTGLTLSGGTLTGITTLPGSGQISAGGELGLLSTPSAAFDITGTYTTPNANMFRITGTMASNVTTTQIGARFGTTFAPSGASLAAINGLSFGPTINSTAFTITNFLGLNASIASGASFTGVVTNGFIFNAATPSINAAATINNAAQFNAATVTQSNGLASSSIIIQQFVARGITSGAAGGTINARGLEITMPSGGASSGTANNRGIYITGNGGTASGGTVNNFALYSDSTANSRILGFLGIGGDPSAQLHLQGNISAAAWTTNGIHIRDGGSTLTDTSSSGTVAAAYTNVLGGNTIAASSATTFTNYYGLYVTAPTVGSGVTFTNSWALGVDTARVATTLRLAGPATDAGKTDAALCRDTTTGDVYSGTGTAGICLGTSSARFKHDISPLRSGLAQVMALKPVSFRYNKGYVDNGARELYGFTAEQVFDVMPELVGLDETGKPTNVDWAGIVPVLVRAIQELKAERR